MIKNKNKKYDKNVFQANQSIITTKSQKISKTKIPCPCKQDCKDRVVGCKSNCGKYKIYEAVMKRKEEISKERFELKVEQWNKGEMVWQS